MRKFFFLAFLVILLGLLAWYWGDFFIKIYRYEKMNAKGFAVIDQWELHEKSNGKFYLSSSYHFFWNEKKYFEKTNFFRNIFLNEKSAKEWMEKEHQKEWQVWFDPENPQRSSLEKIFPLKELFKGAFVSFVFLYFWVFHFMKLRKVFFHS